MKLRVLFFGATADASGTHSTDFELFDDDSVGSVLERLVIQFPRLEDHKLYIALNEEYSELNAGLGDGDELAIFTSVSGG
jgi:molybdopterin converting factor small subunit